MAQPEAIEAHALLLQKHMIALIREFGLHRPDQTPCGTPVSVAEAHALIELSKHEGLAQQALCDRLQLVKSSVSRVVSLLERRGWVERREHPHDRRAVCLFLTERGKAAAQELAQARHMKFAQVLKRIPVKERESVLHALTTLVEALHERH